MVIDAHNHIGVELLNFANGDHPYAQSFESLRAIAESTPVNRWITFPFVSYSQWRLPIVPDAALEPSAIPYEHANHHMLSELQKDFPDNKKLSLPLVIVDPERNPMRQARVLRELQKNYAIYGIKIQGTIIESKVETLLQDGSCLLDFAAEFKLPFLIHSSIHPEDIWSQCSDILRVAEARPEIRFILAHSCRFHRPSLDKVAELPNTWFDCSAHRIHCKLASNDSPIVAKPNERFPSDYQNPSQVLHDLAETYPEKLIWGSDSPYYSWVSSRQGHAERLISTYRDEWRCVADLSPETQTRITYKNTINWLGIDENSL